MRKLTCLMIVLLLFGTAVLSEGFTAGVYSNDTLQVEVGTSSVQKTREFTLTMKNNGLDQIKIIWEECAMTGYEGGTTRMIPAHLASNPEQMPVDTIIEPGDSTTLKVVPYNNIVNGQGSIVELSGQVLSFFIVYEYGGEKRSLPFRVAFPKMKEQSTFDKVFPWAMAGAGAVLVLGIMLWPSN